ncbi:hypothetical protein MTR67_002265 [Solanum verrucosum]|uniref:Uncharacterized protein n=1 Tax=Solanum verrucosum TaxID=315347 RepID=A0AAF0PTC2_SOLVR|nr:hypothetical protein MTR67_002265 [Solanum verrucosum]
MAGVMKSNNALPSQEPEDLDKALEAEALDKAIVIHKDHQVLHGDRLGGHDTVVLDMVEFEEDPLLCSEEVVNMYSSTNREKLLTGCSLGSQEQVHNFRSDELGTRVDLSIAFHLQIDGQLERTIQVLEDMLRACALEFGVGEVSYELAMPPMFSTMHQVFHVSMLLQYVHDESHVLQYEAIRLDDRLTFLEEPIAILARDV